MNDMELEKKSLKIMPFIISMIPCLVIMVALLLSGQELFKWLFEFETIAEAESLLSLIMSGFLIASTSSYWLNPIIDNIGLKIYLRLGGN
jgi:hypothetical protein